jgi:SAM-dependent methyltransferase
MNKLDVSIFKKGKADKNYATDNLVIRWLLNNFLVKIANILQSINSVSSFGLDVGCGEGHLISYLQSKRVIRDLVAIDLDEEKLGFAKQHYPFCEYLKMDINELKFKSNTFDYILANEIFEHLPDPIKTIKEVRRVAKDRAYLIISVPYEPFFHWGNLVRGEYWNRGGRSPGHINLWKRKEFKRFLGEFVEIKDDYCFTTFPWLLYLCKFRPD